MDFETQVLDNLSNITLKLDELIKWKAGQQPVCDQRGKEIDALEAILYGNGDKGVVRRLDSVEDTTKTIRKLWLALIVAGLLGVAGFAMGLFQKADNPNPPTIVNNEK